MEGNISFSGTLAGNIEEGGGGGVTPHITASAAVNDQTGVPGVTVVRSGSDAAPNFDFQFVNLRGADGSPGEPGPRGLTGPAGPEGSQGPRGFTGETGSQGPAGSDGYSPEVTVTDISGGHRVNITDLTHPLGINFDVMDGQNGRDGQDGQAGPQGPQGPAGQGVPTGGSAAQMLVKATNVDYDTEWINNEAVLVDYDNTQSGLQSEDVQGALDELNSNLAQFPKQLTGSVVISTTGTSYVTLFTLAQVRNIFGDNTITTHDIVLSASNGDFSYNSVWIIGTSWANDNLVIRFDQNSSANIRVNYVITRIKSNS